MDAMQNEIRNAFGRHPMKRLATRRASSAEPFGAAEILHGKHLSDGQIDKRLETLGHVERLRPNRCHFDVADGGRAMLRIHGGEEVSIRTQGDRIEIVHGSPLYGRTLSIPWTAPGDLVAMGRVEAMRALSCHARSAIHLLGSAKGRPSDPDEAVERRLILAAAVVATLAGCDVPGARLSLPSPWFAPTLLHPIAPNVRTFEARRFDHHAMDPRTTLLATYLLPRSYALGYGVDHGSDAPIERGCVERPVVIPGPLSIPVEPMNPIEAMRLLPDLMRKGRPIGTRVAALLGEVLRP